MRNAIKVFGLVSVLVLSACGGGNSSGGELKKFVGTWRATAGTGLTNCPGYASDTEALSGNATWSIGVSSDLLGITAFSSCPLMADVTNATASATPGQTCTQSDDSGGTQTMTFAGYTFVVSADGHTATENASGNLTYVVDGVSIACTFTVTGSYEKIGN